MEQGIVYWITGLSGAGKTTLGKLLYDRIYQDKKNVFRLDGDIGRKAYLDNIGYTKEDRKKAAYRHSSVSKMIADQGIDVICCTVSMFDEVRQWNRKNFDKYIEIYLDVPMAVLIQRDQKGLYSKVKNGKTQDVVGMDLRLEFPKTPDIRLVNDGKLPAEEMFEIMWKEIQAVKEKKHYAE